MSNRESDSCSSSTTDKFAEGDFIDPDSFFAKTSKEKDDPELANFLNRVENISSIIQGLASERKDDIERAIRQADILLHDGSGEGTFTGDGDGDEEKETGYKVTTDRSLINKLPELAPGADMSQEAFMRMCEKDAKERAADKKEKKAKSDQFRKKGNVGFKNQNYAEALDNYNKAISLVKDSPCLYMNRGLTYIRIGIYSKAIDDLNMSIELKPDTIKGRLLKARAYFNMTEPKLAREIIQETLELFPENEKMIKEYEKDLFNLEMDKPKNKKTKPDSGAAGSTKENEAKKMPFVSDAEDIWRKAARHEVSLGLGQEENKEQHADADQDEEESE